MQPFCNTFLLEDLDLLNEIMPEPTTVLNDNNACVQWSHNCTTKGLRHIQIRENAIRESIQAGFVSVHHVEGAINLADLFTKEDKCAEHFVTVRNKIMYNPAQKISQSLRIQGGVETVAPWSTQVPLFPEASSISHNK